LYTWFTAHLLAPEMALPMTLQLKLNRPLLIAEVAQAHEGSLGLAQSFIDAAADAGADAIKFQTHIAAAESTYDEGFRVRLSGQDETRYDYWRRMQFTPDQWSGLAEHARRRGLYFLSSPFSVEAVHLLRKVGVAAWKIGSGEVRSRDLLAAVVESGGPVLLSTGMHSWADIDESVELLRRHDAEFAVLQCTSKYPTPLEEVGLNVLVEIRARYGCCCGLSDHSGTVYPALAAFAARYSVVELHVTFDRRMYGPDAPASVTFDELRLIADARDAFSRMYANPVDKDTAAESMSSLRETFGKSITPRYAIAAGTVLTRDMLMLKKPGTGIPAAELGRVVDRTLAVDVSPEHLLRWEDLNE